MNPNEMQFTVSRILIVVVIALQISNCYELSNSTTLESVTIRQDRQQNNILDQLLNSIHGILGQTTKSTVPPLLEDKETTHASAPIVPRPVPIPANRRPGTTNNGGFVNNVIAAASGITSGVFGALGVNMGPHNVPFLHYRTTPRPNQYLPSNTISGPSEAFNKLTGDDKTKIVETTTLESEGIFSSFNFSSSVPLLETVTGILSQAVTCNQIQKLLGHCK